MMLSNAFVNIARADGSVKESMIANLTGTVVNMILDPVFILLFGFGVAGAAVATVIGNIVSIIILFRGLNHKESFLSFKLKDISYKKEVLIKPLILGLPVSAGTLLMSVSYMVINNMLLKVLPVIC